MLAITIALGALLMGKPAAARAQNICGELVEALTLPTYQCKSVTDDPLYCFIISPPP